MGNAESSANSPESSPAPEDRSPSFCDSPPACAVAPPPAACTNHRCADGQDVGAGSSAEESVTESLFGGKRERVRQRVHGNRDVRANARMKYLVHTLGIDNFRTLVESYFGKKVQPWRQMKEWKYMDWMGWWDQGDGKLFYGQHVDNGRVKDDGDFRLKSALRVLVVQPHETERVHSALAIKARKRLW